MAKRKKKDVAPPVERPGDGIVGRNKRARFEYELGQRYEAGMVLMGSEVKMLRQTTADLTDAYCVMRQGEVFMHGLNIPEMSGTPWGHAAKRPRKLLLNRHEIEQLQRGVERQGMTVVATLVYFRGGRAKVEIALAKGKRTIDKRNTVKARQADRETRAAIKRHS